MNNGVFLSHNYVKYPVYVAKVPDLCAKMHMYECPMWFVNVGILDASGGILNAEVELAQCGNFVDAVRDNSVSPVTLIAWVNGIKTTTDIRQKAVRDKVIATCLDFLDSMDFDGILLDIEPAGNDPVFADYLRIIVDHLKALRPGSQVGVAAHKFGDGSEWYNDSDFYRSMARRCDFITAMTYNSGSSDAAAYQAWIKTQTISILESVASVPDSAKVIIGFPAYPASTHHSVTAETIESAAKGVEYALEFLPAETSINMGGTAVYLHTDGNETDGYASCIKQWWHWGRHWLGAW